jgi:hypothetical protein
MRQTTRIVVLLAGLVTPALGGSNMSAAAPDNPTPEQVLARLVKEHPRVMARAADFAAIRERVAQRPEFAELYKKVKAAADKLLTAEPSKYEIPDGLRLLATSRRVLDRVTTLAMVYQVSGERQYVDRAWKELEAAAAFKDWNPRHFLDTAEMTCALAIGYDWLYREWSPEQRRTLREAMVRLGLQPGLACHEASGASNWWPKCSHNWNQVCNGGLVVGSLAIADEEPELAGKLVSLGVASVRLPMAEFAPDGAWGEGPGYWDYATSYNVYLLAALDSALGTDFGLSKIAGFDRTGEFPEAMVSPLGTSFDFADAHGGPIVAPQMYWLANRFGRPDFARHQDRYSKSEALDLLWRREPPKTAAEVGLPLCKLFHKAEVARLWNGREDRHSLWLALKAGDNKVNHSHLDLGTFILEARGERFVVDLGSDDYNLPGYFRAEGRWNFYRLRAEGHNTLVINPGAGTDQDPKAAATVGEFVARDGYAKAVTDLTAAYGPSGAKRVVRTFEMSWPTETVPAAPQATIIDVVELAAEGDVWWFLHTPAEVTLADDGRAATLTLRGQTMKAKLVEPAATRFAVMDAKPLPSSPTIQGQNVNQGIRKLVVHLAGVRAATIKVTLQP